MIGRRDALRDLLGRRVKRIVIKPFMDMHTMIEERLVQCCVHVGTRGEQGHQCVPFCAAQAWPALHRMKLSERAATPTVETPRGASLVAR